METIENLVQYYTLGNDIQDDFEIKHNLHEEIKNRFKIYENEIKSYHFYTLKISKKLSRIN